VLQVARSAADAGWVSAWATVVLAVFAFVTAIFAWLAFRKQAKEVNILVEQAREQHALNIRQIEVLELQAQELRQAPEIRAREIEAQRQDQERQAEAKRRAQAEEVFLLEDRSDHDPRITQVQRNTGVKSGAVIIATVRNASNAPITEVRLTWHKGTASWGEVDYLNTHVGPGGETQSIKSLPDDLPSYVDTKIYGAVAYFRDAAGRNWRRGPDGEPQEILPGQPLP
jgi:hypothetical protein